MGAKPHPNVALLELILLAAGWSTSEDDTDRSLTAMDFYDREGNPLPDLLAFIRLAENMDYKRVALTEINADITVSTVWLGIDHSFGAGPPLIFETMVFGGPFGFDRYTTEVQALAGHDQMVATVRALVFADT